MFTTVLSPGVVLYMYCLSNVGIKQSTPGCCLHGSDDQRVLVVLGVHGVEAAVMCASVPCLYARL